MEDISENIRRSRRSTRGQAPHRYGYDRNFGAVNGSVQVQDHHNIEEREDEEIIGQFQGQPNASQYGGEAIEPEVPLISEDIEAAFNTMELQKQQAPVTTVKSQRRGDKLVSVTTPGSVRSAKSNMTTTSAKARRDLQLITFQLQEQERILKLEAEAAATARRRKVAEAQAAAEAEAEEALMKLEHEKKLGQLRLQMEQAKITVSECNFNIVDGNEIEQNTQCDEDEQSIQELENQNVQQRVNEWVNQANQGIINPDLNNHNETFIIHRTSGSQHISNPTFNQQERLNVLEPPRQLNSHQDVNNCVSINNCHENCQQESNGRRSRSKKSEELHNHDQRLHERRSTSPKSQKSNASTVQEKMVETLNEMTTALKHRYRKPRDLPIFSGDPMEWPLFLAQYKMTTKTDHVSNEDNVYRLQKCLKGKAKEAVQAMLLLPENLDIVIKTLTNNFGKPKQIIQALIMKVKDTPSCKEYKPEMLRDLSNCVTNLVATMQLVQCEGYLTSPELIDSVLSKIPLFQKNLWGEYVVKLTGREPTLSDLSVFLKERADAAAALVNYSASPKHEEKYDDKIKMKKQKIRDSVSNTTEAKPYKSEVSTCEFCKKSNHKLDKCRNFLKEDISKKWEFVKKNQFCFCCLKAEHQVKDCKQKKDCNINNCKKLHHPCLHSDVKKLAEENVESVSNVTKQNESENIVLLKVIPVFLKGPKKEIMTYALLDDASTVTMIDSELAEELGATGPSEDLRLQWTNSAKENVKSKRISLIIRGKLEQAEFEMENVRTVPNLNLRPQSLNMKKMKSSWQHFKNLEVYSHFNAKPKILIGQDHCELIQGYQVVEGKPNEPKATRTKLGWVLHGKLSSTNGRTDCEYTCHVTHDEDLHQLVKESFKTEDFGVRISKQPIRSKEDAQIIKMMDEVSYTIPIEEGIDRWVTGLPWKNSYAKLPESKCNALKRLYSLEKKLDKDPKYASKYYEKMEHNMKQSYAHRLTKEEAETENPRTWYLPHFAVEKSSKPGKLRIVFDAAAESRGVRLNDALLQGPDLLNPLPNVLFKFRENKIGFTADIKEMFPQIKIRPEDSAAQRFLYRGKDRIHEPYTYEMTSMIFGAISSPYCAQEIKNKNARRFQDEFPEEVDAIVHRHYMDDYLDSSTDVASAVRKIKNIIKIHQAGSFVICNWICSSREVLTEIPENLRSISDDNLDFGSDLPSEKVLGLQWNPNKDIFQFGLKFHTVPEEIVFGIRTPTKREVLKLVMSIFDPLGFLSLFTIKAKIILQQIWKSEIGWDDCLKNEEAEAWFKWLEELKSIVKFQIPRCYCPDIQEAKEIQLHIFCDASKIAFSAAAYLRLDVGKEIRTAFVTAKSRVAPIKYLSIPRLELQGALMASRLADAIKAGHSIKFNKVFFWTDSMTIIRWLRSDTKIFKTFVAHRIGEIEERTDLKDWRWIPTKQNVADQATRNIEECDFSQRSTWLNGPSFLLLPENLWPKEMKKEEASAAVEDEEAHKEYVNSVVEIKPLADFQRYSSWSKLVRVFAYVLRFIKIKLKKIKAEQPNLTVKELQDAEIVLLKQVQASHYLIELSSLQKEKSVERSSSLYQMSPKLDKNGLMRMQGRTDRAENLNMETKQPIILHPKHKITNLIIQKYHESAGHQGMEFVVNELRQKYCIPKIRAAVKDVWKKCIKCKINKAKPVIPEMGQIPEFRLQEQVRAFTIAGVDYFGPIEVTIGRRREKRYGVLFTCLSVRAVHLEIANSLSTDSAIMALRRFISRRGCPQVLYSDNGTNFHGAANEIRKAVKELDQDKIQDEMSLRGIQWKFIPPSAPHMGGCWERLIQSVKKSFGAVLKERAPREEVLQTLFTEAEHMVNSRPLTHVSVDPMDPESLTPNHFLIGKSSEMPTFGLFDENDIFLRKQWRLSQRLSDHFWKRWIKEYLPSLTRRTKWNQKMKPATVGDLVFICDGDLPRGCWPRGKIVAVFPGKDEQVRVVDVQTAAGTYRRPVSKICILDIDVDEVSDSGPKPGRSMSATEREKD